MFIWPIFSSIIPLNLDIITIPGVSCNIEQATHKPPPPFQNRYHRIARQNFQALVWTPRRNSKPDLRRTIPTARRHIYIELDSTSLRTKSQVTIHLSVLQADRQTYNKVLTFLFGNNVLYLDIHATMAIQFLQSVPDGVRMIIESPTLEPGSTSNCSCVFSRKFCEYLASEMALDTLTVKD